MLPKGPFLLLAPVILTSVLTCARSREAPSPGDSLKPADSTGGSLETHPVQTTPTSPWADARRRGVDFRAIGQEPGWLLEIDSEKSMYLLADYGDRKVTVPTPKPRGDSNGTITYESTAEGHRLTAAIRKRVCHDAMSGEAFTHEVTVTLDGTEYRGCGRQLE